MSAEDKAKEEKVKPEILVGLDLDGWKVERFIGVYTTDCEGRSTSQLPRGLYKDQTVADSIKEQETYIALYPVIALTDGKQAFLLEGEAVVVCDDEKERLERRKKVLAKLSPEERKILGFEP